MQALRAALARTFTAVYVGFDGASFYVEPRVDFTYDAGHVTTGVAVPLPRRDTVVAGSGVPL